MQLKGIKHFLQLLQIVLKAREVSKTWLIDMIDKVTDYKQIYESILTLDEKIRFVGIINDLGRLVYGGMRPGVMSLESETESIKIYMEFALISKLHTDFDSKLGEVFYSLTVRKKIKMLSFPVSDHIIRISLERDADHEKIANEILELLKPLDKNRYETF
ncbi:DUF6659 family protein [Candidatus Nitrosocosmicus hydrocola]|uniref:DUF6659 family protein n=1 Tax=Candidatus Nitrosocosmicus hydrocola TaxID=1826872 RepID=UPI0013723B6B|nr:DUF6659 family protein [Candidatus Nitrosocosmicus hydrocola]